MFPPAGSRYARPALPAAVPAADAEVAVPAVVEAIAPVAPPPRKLARRRPPNLVAIARQPTPAEEATFASVETELGGRGQLVATLTAAPLDPKSELLLGAIADPQNEKLSLAAICVLHGVKLDKILDWFGKAALARGRTIALARIGAKSADVAAAVMDAALPGRQQCDRCLGAARIEKQILSAQGVMVGELVECPKCHGLGEVPYLPPHDTQKTALQLAGLLDKGAGAGARIANIMLGAGAGKGGGAAAHMAGFDSMITSLDSILYGQGRERLGRAAPSEPAASEGEIVE